ncbi:MAG TPA: hypothetical protein VF173_24120 [Thermoanaerobaculia bacterium]|nr:hypothetical protein [Thermoanaerobaculia bacterium]
MKTIQRRFRADRSTHRLQLPLNLFYPWAASHRTSRGDWRRHFGSRWPQFAAAKEAFDPEALLAPGQGIFRKP